MKRRTFVLAGAGAGGALLLGWSLRPPRQRLTPSVALPEQAGRLVLNGWVAVSDDDTVTAWLPKSEMGQGIHTALAMVLAEELDVPLAQVRVAMAPVDAIYHNLIVGRDALPFSPEDDPRLRRVLHWFSDKTMREFGVMTTGGSTSVRDTWGPLRDAASLARATLVAEAARRWGVAADACEVRDGIVQHGDRRVRFGELVRGVRTLPPAEHFVRKAPATYRLIGTEQPRLDAHTKATGEARYGIDARPDGLVYAALALPPTLGGAVRAFDEAAARSVPGVRAVVRLTGRHGGPQGVAVIASSWPLARRGVDALAITWDDGPHATVSSEAIARSLEAQARTDGGRVFRNTGDARRRLADARAANDRLLDVVYAVPYLAHTTMEPPNCTVRVDDDAAEVWVGTQVPEQARAAAAEVLGLAPSRVVLHVPYLGGGFGRRLEVDMVGQAAEIARAVPGTPVQVIWSREDDLRHDFYRPAAATRCVAALDAEGRVHALDITTATQEVTRPYGRRALVPLARFDTRKGAVEGLFDQPYDFAALRVAHQLAEHPVPVGYWRGVGHSINAFVLESVIDELAALANADPLAFRLALLSRHPRARAVLEEARTASAWETPAVAADGAPIARGVAFHRSFGSCVAQVAEVSLGADASPRVHRVTCVVDCGLAINPDGVRQQMESAVAFGLSAALWGEVRIETGRVQPGNFDAWRVLRLAEMPAVSTHVLPSTEAPEGVGEIGVPSVAPAVANALFALTGQRARTLPLAAHQWRLPTDASP